MEMIYYLGGALSTLITIAVLVVVAPTKQFCEPGYYVDGVDPTGWYQCRQTPTLQHDEESPPHWRPADDLPGEGNEYRGRVWCTGGQMPIVVNEKTVGCQLGGWRQ